VPDGLRLEPANPDYPSIERPLGAVEVIGLIVSAIRVVE